MWKSIKRPLACSSPIILFIVVAMAISAVVSSPIMVPSGKIGPIVPPTPRPKKIIRYPLKEPAPVYEYPDPGLLPPQFNGEFNSIEPVGAYEGYPKIKGVQLRNPPPLPVGVYSPRTIAAISGKYNHIVYQLSLKYPQYKLHLY